MKVFETLKPVDSSEITKLIAEGKVGEIATRMKAYEDQQALIRSGAIKLQRVCCKPNKKGNLYIQHPSINTTTKQMNFHGALEPAIKAIVTNADLFEMVQAYYISGVHVEEHRIIEPLV